MEPNALFKCLADETRLKTVLLIQSEGELCVCELTSSLETSQPKVSRHLAQLRECGLLNTRRAGQWVYYSINNKLPGWALSVLENTVEGNPETILACCDRLKNMGDRPQRDLDHCGATQ